LDSWLIDADRDVDGLRVIADLHGGDLDDPTAIAEYDEIREKVRENVGLPRHHHFHF
jgi:hypothetical protein